MYARILGLAFGLAFGLTVFQNCAQPVAFNSGEAYNSQSGSPTVEPVVPPEPIPEKGAYSFGVQTTTKEHLPLVKLIMIVDNSNSMKRYQDLLATGVKSMLAKLKSQKLNVDFHIYTTSAAPGFTNSSAEALPIEYVDPTGGAITAAQANGKPHVRKLKYRLAKSLALENNAALGFRATMTDAEMNAISDKLEAKIKAVGVTGSDTESGLCTMLRVLKDKDANKIVAAGDRVAVVVLSDEDDSVKIENCYDSAEEVYKAVATDTKCSSTAAECKAPYIYRATYNSSNVLKFTVAYDNPACVMDGGLTEACKVSRGLTIDCAKSPSLCPGGTPNSTLVTCTAAQQSAASAALTIDNARVTSCKVAYAENLATVSLTNQMDKGLCGKSLTVGGVTYTDVADYMKRKYPSVTAAQWRDTCAEYGLVDVVKKTETVIKNSLVDTGSLPIEQTKALATSLLGANSFRLSFVINDTKANMTETCPAGTENNKGLLYRALGDLLPAQSFVSSICAKNYDAAMGDLGKFIENIANRSYTLNLVKRAKIDSVSIERAGVSGAVDAADYTYTEGTPANITFKDGYLQPGDKITLKWIEIL